MIATCANCGKDASAVLVYCGPCIRDMGSDARPVYMEAHASIRERFGLPTSAPSAEGGVCCGICANNCSMNDGQMGYCAIRRADSGRLTGADWETGYGDWYYDPIPTNCVASWICDLTDGKNLAVFYASCSFDCLFCQNWHFRLYRKEMPADEVIGALDTSTRCICFFGGDPSTQMTHALHIGEIGAEMGLRICWETNGFMSHELAIRMMRLAVDSNGIVKFDLKAYHPSLHEALTGQRPERTYMNFKRISAISTENLCASTLLVTGYVDALEVERIASFIADIDPNIPYSLLAFHPQFEMMDLPPTPRSLAQKCLTAARNAGLRRIHLGNVHLLW